MSRHSGDCELSVRIDEIIIILVKVIIYSSSELILKHSLM